jgi:hypothetical protein
MEGYTLYLVLLGALALLVLGGGLLKKLLKKADIDLSDDQLDAVTLAVSDAVSQVEEINKKLVASGGQPMDDDEKLKVATELAKDLALAAGVSQVKVEILLKLMHAAVAKAKAEKKVFAAAALKPKKLKKKARKKKVVRKKKRPGR